MTDIQGVLKKWNMRKLTHEWKLIPPYLSEKSFSTSFKFHSNLPLRSNKTKFFLSFLKENYLELQKKNLAMVTEIPTCVLSQFLWYNKSIQVENCYCFSKKIINYVSQLFSDIVSLQYGMNLGENTTYMKIHTFNGYN